MDPPDRELFQLLSQVASLYYLEEKTQSEVAEELGLSRQKVHRLLKQARELQIVEIHVHSIPVPHAEQEAHLKACFNLQDVVIAPSHPDEDRCRLNVGRAAAAYLARQLREGYTVAVGLGRNTREVANSFHPAHEHNCTFVSAMGGSPYIGESINPNNIISVMAAQAGGIAQQLYAPAYLESQRVRDMVMDQQAIKELIDLARQADVALVGIGTPADDSILVEAGCISVAEVRRLREVEAVGEIIGNYYDEDGKPVDSDLRGRLIALTLDELARIPQVIGIASEQEKTSAILGALRSGAVDVLITDCSNAARILRMVGVSSEEEAKVPQNGTCRHVYDGKRFEPMT
jgi:DNA-binding transcriptional regulator LsrR (DeoR family)